MRLIDADAIDDVVMRLNAEGDSGITRSEYKLIDSVLFEFPTVDAEPVRHGKWEVVDAEEPRRYGCSECKRLVWHLGNYCPNCGCRILEEGE